MVAECLICLKYFTKLVAHPASSPPLLSVTVQFLSGWCSVCIQNKLEWHSVECIPPPRSPLILILNLIQYEIIYIYPVKSCQEEEMCIFFPDKVWWPWLQKKLWPHRAVMCWSEDGLLVAQGRCCFLFCQICCHFQGVTRFKEVFLVLKYMLKQTKSSTLHWI